MHRLLKHGIVIHIHVHRGTVGGCIFELKGVTKRQAPSNSCRPTATCCSMGQHAGTSTGSSLDFSPLNLLHCNPNVHSMTQAMCSEWNTIILLTVLNNQALCQISGFCFFFQTSNTTDVICSNAVDCCFN